MQSQSTRKTSPSRRAHLALTLAATSLPALVLCLIAPIIFPAATPAVHAAPKPTGDPKSGEAVFQQKCFQCHSIQPDEVRFGPSLYHEVKKPKPKMTEAEVRLIIKNGKNKMPAWGALLTPEQQDDLIAYIRTL